MNEKKLSRGFVDASFGPACALRDVWMARGQNLASSVLTTAQPHSPASRPQAPPLLQQIFDKKQGRKESKTKIQSKDIEQLTNNQRLHLNCAAQLSKQWGPLLTRTYRYGATTTQLQSVMVPNVL